MNILGIYKKLNLALIEKDGEYFVTDKRERKVLYRGDEEACTKVFVMMIARFIEKDLVN